MARPYKGYRAARAVYGHDRTPDVHRSSRYNVSRTPVISAVATPGAGSVVTVDTSLTAVPDGSAVAVVIDFGEGAPVAGGAAVAHDYATPGVKSIVVTATAADGFIATKTLSVTAAD